LNELLMLALAVDQNVRCYLLFLHKCTQM